MLANKTDSDFSENTLKASGTNYSVDSMKKAAFVDEINNVLLTNEMTVDKEQVLLYLNERVKQINAKYDK